MFCFIHLFEGKKKKKNVEPVIDTNKTAYEQIYIFCLMWSFGAFLETHDRNRFEVYLQKHTKLKMPTVPEGESIFNYNVNVHTGGRNTKMSVFFTF